MGVHFMLEGVSLVLVQEGLLRCEEGWKGAAIWLRLASLILQNTPYRLRCELASRVIFSWLYLALTTS